jgi:hypothetical protein
MLKFDQSKISTFQPLTTFATHVLDIFYMSAAKKLNWKLY